MHEFFFHTFMKEGVKIFSTYSSNIFYYMACRIYDGKETPENYSVGLVVNTFTHEPSN